MVHIGYNKYIDPHLHDEYHWYGNGCERKTTHTVESILLLLFGTISGVVNVQGCIGKRKEAYFSS